MADQRLKRLIKLQRVRGLDCARVRTSGEKCQPVHPGTELRQESSLLGRQEYLVEVTFWKCHTALLDWVSTRRRRCCENNPILLTWRMHWPWLPARRWGLFSWTQSGGGTRRKLKLFQLERKCAISLQLAPHLLFIHEIFRVSNAHHSSTPEHVCHLGCQRRGKRLPSPFRERPPTREGLNGSIKSTYFPPSH